MDFPPSPGFRCLLESKISALEAECFPGSAGGLEESAMDPGIERTQCQTPRIARWISQHHQAHVDIAASRIRIGTYDVGLPEERFSLVPRHAWERDAQLGFYPEAIWN